MYVIPSSIDTDEPIMLINNAIGFSASDSGGSYIDGALFQHELMELDNMGKKRIQIHINSVGGNVMEGYNICAAILKSKTPVDTYCVGIAASMAGAIFMCGRKRIMMDYATLMIHNPFGGTDKKQLTAMRDSLVTMISAKSSISKDQVAYLCDRESWISSSECFAQGFATDIEVTGLANQKRMPLADTGVRAMWQEANLIHNNILNSNNMETSAKATSLSQIAAYLDLNTEASENSILQEVKSRINKEVNARGAAEDTIGKMKKDLEAAENKFNALKAQYDQACKDINDSAAKAKKEADDVVAKAKIDADAAAANLKKVADDARAVEAKTMVEVFATAKRIKSDTVPGWIDTALKIGVQEAKKLIEGLPLNQNASSASAAADAGAGGGTPAASQTNAMALMAEVVAKNKKRA